MNLKRILLISLVILSLMVGTNSVYGAGGDFWEKNINFSNFPNFPPGFPYIYNKYLAVSSTLCIVYGQASQIYGSPPSPSNQIMGFIIVYDIATGNEKWSRPLTFGIKNSYQLVLDRYVVYISSTSESPNQYILGAYNANTGVMIWEKSLSIMVDNIEHMTGPLASNRICTLGLITTENSSSIILRAYQGQNTSSAPTNSILLLDE